MGHLLNWWVLLFPVRKVEESGGLWVMTYGRDSFVFYLVSCFHWRMFFAFSVSEENDRLLFSRTSFKVQLTMYWTPLTRSIIIYLKLLGWFEQVAKYLFLDTGSGIQVLEIYDRTVAALERLRIKDQRNSQVALRRPSNTQTSQKIHLNKLNIFRNPFYFTLNYFFCPEILKLSINFKIFPPRPFFFQKLVHESKRQKYYSSKSDKKCG